MLKYSATITNQFIETDISQITDIRHRVRFTQVVSAFQKENLTDFFKVKF